jgi:hypothetical protein
MVFEDSSVIGMLGSRTISQIIYYLILRGILIRKLIELLKGKIGPDEIVDLYYDTRLSKQLITTEWVGFHDFVYCRWSLRM